MASRKVTKEGDARSGGAEAYIGPHDRTISQKTNSVGERIGGIYETQTRNEKEAKVMCVPSCGPWCLAKSD